MLGLAILSVEEKKGDDPKTGREKRVLLGWSGFWCFSGACPFPSCFPPGLCVTLCLLAPGGFAGSILFFGFSLRAPTPEPSIFSGLPYCFRQGEPKKNSSRGGSSNLLTLKMYCTYGDVFCLENVTCRVGLQLPEHLAQWSQLGRSRACVLTKFSFYFPTRQVVDRRGGAVHCSLLYRSRRAPRTRVHATIRCGIILRQIAAKRTMGSLT